jgi:hypothetical protein
MADNNGIPIIANIIVIHLIYIILPSFVFLYSSDGVFEDLSTGKGYNKTVSARAVL